MNETKSIQVNGEFCIVIGNVDLLKRQKQGLLCSRKCPADKILEAYDRFKEWAATPEITVVSGFHSPVEQECLRLLLRGKAGIILYSAREIEHIRISKEWKSVVEEGRMLILSPFKERRASRHTTHERNKRVRKLSDDLYVPFVTPGGQLEQLTDIKKRRIS